MRDKIHGAVRKSLENAGWIISKDLYRLRLKGSTKIEIDLEAQKIEKDTQEIYCVLIEVKTLGKRYVLHDFYQAYGQYSFYKYWLKKKEIHQDIYLATSITSYQKINKIPALKEWIVDEKVNLLIVDVENEKIVEWIKY